MSSSEKKKKEKEKPSLLSLPNEVLVSCIARVSRLYYPTLSLVCKRFRYLLVSPELYKVRSSLNHTESCLYVCIRFCDSNYRWFTLCRKPTDQPTEKSSDYVLARVTTQHSTPPELGGLVAVGSNIYNITSDLYSVPSVSILDCRSHSWSGSSLKTSQTYLTASLLDQKIYVARRFHHKGSKAIETLVDVFDTKTRIWDLLSIPCNEIQGRRMMLGSACIDGKFHLKTETEVAAYDSEEGRWDLFGPKVVGAYMLKDYHCVIDNVLYSFFGGTFRWYDSEVRMWRSLRGSVSGLLEYPYPTWVNLAAYGGNLAVLWTKGLQDYRIIWCAEISLEKRNSCEIWGTVEWFDEVFIAVPGSGFLKVVEVLATTV